jgi:hypothetical protein
MSLGVDPRLSSDGPRPPGLPSGDKEGSFPRVVASIDDLARRAVWAARSAFEDAMTPDKLKKAARERRKKTGESYTTARRHVLAEAGYEPDACPGCGTRLAQLGDAKCSVCSFDDFERAGFDHSPDYWDPD